MSVAEASKVNPDSYFELLDPSAASFTFQTFADGKRDPGLAAIFEGTWRTTNASRAVRH
jgi:hypothetical protein